MRNLTFPGYVFVAALLAAPLSMQAQFQKPTPEELSMTADANDPDADAVVLTREVKYDDTLHFHSEYLRIKVLKEKAKELATVHIYEQGMRIAFPGMDLHGAYKVDQVEGRTIHADGTVIPLTGKLEELLHSASGSGVVQSVVFNLPSVEVGSILEYRYSIHYPEMSTIQYVVHPPDWELQMRYPVRYERFSYIAPPEYFDDKPGRSSSFIMDHHGNQLNDLIWYQHLPAGKELQQYQKGRFRVELNDVPAMSWESWMPPDESVKYQVKFYMAANNQPSAYWNMESGFWLKDVEHFAEKTAAIKTAAAGLVGATDSDLDKAKKIYAAVQTLENTDFTRHKEKEELKVEGLKVAKRAEDTWNQKSGSGHDLALLYLALARSAGLNAYPAKIADRRHRIFDSNYESFYQLDAMVIVLEIGGKEVVVDPAEKMCPFEIVSWQHSGAGGLRQTDKGTVSWISPLQPFNSNTTTRRAELTIDAAGQITGKLQFGFSGQEALEWRQKALRVDESEFKSELDKWMATQIPQGLVAHVTRMARIDDPSGDLGVYASVSGAGATTTASRIIVPASFFSTPDGHTFTEQKKRQWSVDMHFAAQFKDGVLYHLPAGYAVESLPQSAPISWQGHAVWQVNAKATGTDVTVTHALARAFTMLEASEYSQLRDFYQKVATADQQQLVLSAAAKGN